MFTTKLNDPLVLTIFYIDKTLNRTWKQGKKLKGEGILVNDKRDKTAKRLRSFVIQWFNLKSPATLTRVSVPITSYFWYNKIASL